MADGADDTERFAALFDAHFDDLWRFARRRTSSGDIADDVTAQVFAVAWRRRDELPASAERLWLFGVARRVLANERRAATRRERLHRKLTSTDRRDDGATPADGPSIPALDVLTGDEREAVQLRYWDELTVTEIATLLECTANTVSMRLHKARRKLLAETATKDRGDHGHVAASPELRREDTDERA